MTRTVRDAADMLTVMAGSDPKDPATAEADARKGDYAAGLRRDALKGVRVGVMRYAAGFHRETDVVFEQALAALKAQGAILVDVPDFPNRREIGANELVVLLTELKVGMNAYLASTDPTKVKVRSLADVIAFLAARYFGMANYGAIYGALYMPFGIGSAISPILYGKVRDLTGGYDAMLGAAVAMFALGGAMLQTMATLAETVTIIDRLVAAVGDAAIDTDAAELTLH
eukprot:gene2077-2796_t